MAPSVVPGIGEATGSLLSCARKSPRSRSAPSSARQKVDLPTLLAPTMYTSRPLRSRSVAPATPLTPLWSRLRERAATVKVPATVSRLRSSSSCSHSRTAACEVPLGSRSNLVPTAITGLRPMASRTRPSMVPDRSVRSSSSSTSTRLSRSCLSSATSSSCETRPRPRRSARPWPSTALTIAPCESSQQRAHRSWSSWWCLRRRSYVSRSTKPGADGSSSCTRTPQP
mmetsp:Transcript_13835/g.57808  ORF Transcript_13835/g.57808 Transcript_13835/m.57808 type:complete len:227 (+) Transcript_13835:759-1439(+)